jgi:hypothetical protein
MEHECIYINSRGILKSCTKYQLPLKSSNSLLQNNFLDGVKQGDRVYVCTAAIPTFARTFLPNLTVKIVLVSGDADEYIPAVDPSGCTSILNSPYIVQWFAQNCLVDHAKMVKIPIGMDYHALSEMPYPYPWGPKEPPYKQEATIQRLIDGSLPFWQRKPMCYTTFNIEMNRGDRLDAYLTLPSELVFYEASLVLRLDSHKRQTDYAFVVSPYGYGFDCHRTWEALVLGCIPIVKSNAMDSLFDDLPVLIIKEWSDITQELLDSTIRIFKEKTFNYDKLKMKYWQNLIHCV